MQRCWDIYGCQPKLYVDSQAFKDYKEKVLFIERLVLEVLKFKLTIHHPYSFIVAFIAKIGLPDRQRVVNTSWCFVNDR